MRKYVAQRHRLPLMASSMAASLGVGFDASRADADMICPAWQYPHCGTSISIHARCTGWDASADSPSTVIEPASTRDHTERLLHLMGVTVTREGLRVTVEPPTKRLIVPHEAGAALEIPGDPSSAAFFAVAGAICKGSHLLMTRVGLNSSRMHFLKVLQRMDAGIVWDIWPDPWEVLGKIEVRGSELQATTIEAAEVPLLIDEVPVLMVAAACAQGLTTFHGLQELRVKETDRVRSMVTDLRRMGATIEEQGPDDLVIMGGALHGAEVDGFGDHRTVMSLAVAALRAEGSTTIHGREAVDKSFKSFFKLLTDATSPSTVRLS